MLDTIFERERMDAWFKWLEWVTLTAVVCGAWWEVRSYFLIPFIIISFAYVWFAGIRGIGALLILPMQKFNLKQSTIEITLQVIGSILSIGMLMTLTTLFIGIFKSAS